MAILVRKSKERGMAHHGWLESYHTFSFADYYNPSQMGFGPLRVINEDYIEAQMGFGTHPHKDMEIITFVIEGALEHQDTLGNKTIIRPGEIQIMSAGTGIQHSEYSHEKNGRTHLYQIWIYPSEKNLKPSYGQKSYLEKLKAKNFICLASSDGRDDSVIIHQDATLSLLQLKKNEKFNLEIGKGRCLWVQAVKGNSLLNKTSITGSDAVAIEDESLLTIEEQSDHGEYLIFDLAKVWKRE